MATCRLLIEKYDGKVPRDIETLHPTRRWQKNSKWVASNAFGVDAIAVDSSSECQIG